MLDPEIPDTNGIVRILNTGRGVAADRFSDTSMEDGILVSLDTNGGIVMIKKAMLSLGALVVLMNAGCGLGAITGVLQPVDSIMQLLDLLRTFAII